MSADDAAQQTESIVPGGNRCPLQSASRWIPSATLQVAGCRKQYRCHRENVLIFIVLSLISPFVLSLIRDVTEPTAWPRADETTRICKAGVCCEAHWEERLFRLVTSPCGDIGRKVGIGIWKPPDRLSGKRRTPTSVGTAHIGQRCLDQVWHVWTYSFATNARIQARADQPPARGKFETMNHPRDTAYQGCVNPVLKDFGASSEARQYSGSSVNLMIGCASSVKPILQYHEGFFPMLTRIAPQALKSNLVYGPPSAWVDQAASCCCCCCSGSSTGGGAPSRSSCQQLADGVRAAEAAP